MLGKAFFREKKIAFFLLHDLVFFPKLKKACILFFNFFISFLSMYT